MGDLKRECPVCHAYTNAVGAALYHGEPCPHCGASSETIEEIDRVRRTLGDEALKARVEELLVELSQVTVDRDRLARTVVRVRGALDEDAR